MTEFAFEPAKTEKPAVADDLLQAAAEIRALHDKDLKQASQLKEKQGGIGWAVDALVNLFDRSIRSQSSLGLVKDHMISYGSAAMDTAVARQGKEISRLEEAAAAGDRNAFQEQYKKLSGHEWLKQKPGESQLMLQSSQALKKYQDNHFFYLDLSTTFGSMYAGMLARYAASNYSSTFRVPLLAAMAAGAIAKPLLTFADGEHFNPARDAMVGAIWGGLYPVYEWSGARTSELLLRSGSLSRFIGGGKALAIESPGLFSSAIKPVKGSLIRSAIASDAAFVVPGFIAYDSIGYPAQLAVDRKFFKQELPTIGETGISHAQGIAAGLIMGPLVGIPSAQLTRYLTRPLITRAGKLLGL